LAEDVVDSLPPDEAALQKWLQAHPEDYAQEPRYTLRQVYFSRDRRGDAVELDAEQALVLLRSGDLTLDAATLGDPLPLPHRLVDEREGALAAQFGTVFADAVAGLDPSAWQGPVPSGFGLHLVLVEDAKPGRALTLEEARTEVLRDWQNQQRREGLERLYLRLAEQYSVRVEPAPGTEQQ
jgi:hypothetical protein